MGLPYTIILDGKLNHSELPRAGITKDDILKEIKKQGATKISDVFIASIDAEDEMFVQL